MTPYEILNAPALVQAAIATGQIKKPTAPVTKERREYIREWMRNRRAGFYRAGLTALGKPRKYQQHLGRPSYKDHTAYMRFVRKTWTDAGLTTEGKPRKYRARKEKV